MMMIKEMTMTTEKITKGKRKKKMTSMERETKKRTQKK
jgi:hypothetical protein